KVVFQGNSARVYVNHATSPALLVPQLKIKDQPGALIGLKALDGAYFTNFTFTPLAPSTPEVTVTETAPPRTIMQWQLSNSFAVQGKLAIPLALPQENKLTWQVVSTEASGLLNVSAYRPKGTTAGFPNKSEDLVWLKASIPAEKQQYQQLFLEFSNKAQVFLNGQPLLYADNSFRAKGATYRGDIDKKLNSNALFLPLKKGQNTLLIALSSTSEGWGIMARLVDALPSP
ncbi:MAG: hypothetical protein ACO1OQ_12895, partial [Rufibacter sp.]